MTSKDALSNHASEEGRAEGSSLDVLAQVAAQQKLWIVKPSQVDDLWEHEDPSAYCQELLLEHLDILSEENDFNLKRTVIVEQE